MQKVKKPMGISFWLFLMYKIDNIGKTIVALQKLGFTGEYLEISSIVNIIFEFSRHPKF
jgi:hypothetical protein